MRLPLVLAASALLFVSCQRGNADVAGCTSALQDAYSPAALKAFPQVKFKGVDKVSDEIKVDDPFNEMKLRKVRFTVDNGMGLGTETLTMSCRYTAKGGYKILPE